jgi:Phage integrase, N-terminal SAM-like domain
MRTEIRARHYSLRAEQAYEHWIRRFVTFHSLKSPQELGPEAVKEYLEFLAEERQISASTVISPVRNDPDGFRWC